MPFNFKLLFTNNKKCLLALTLILISFSIYAQTWNNAFLIEGPGTQEIIESVVDDSGNVYLFGNFQDTLIYGSDSLFNLGPNPTSPLNSKDLFLIKLDSNFQLVWKKHFFGTNNPGNVDTDNATDMYLSFDSKLYITWVYNSGYNFQVDSFTITGSQAYACISLNGNVQYVKTIGSSGMNPNHIVADTLGNVFIAGFYNNAQIFNGVSLPKVNSFESFVACFDTLGNFNWVKSFSGPGNNPLNDIEVDNRGNVIWCGNGDQYVNFQGGSILAKNNAEFGLVIAIDSTGSIIWNKQVISEVWFGTSQMFQLQIDNTGNIWLVGQGYNFVSIDSMSYNHSTPFAFLFSSKLTNDGEPILIKDVFYTGASAKDLTIDKSGNLFLAINNKGVAKIDGLGGIEWIKPNSADWKSVCLLNNGTLLTLGDNKGLSQSLDTLPVILPYQSNDRDIIIGEIPLNCNYQIQPEATIIGNNPFCISDSILVVADSGFVSYLWLDGTTNDSNTFFQSTNSMFLVWDTNNCKGVSQNYPLISNPDVSVNVYGNTSFCDGDSVIFEVNLTNGTYLWSNNAITQSIKVFDTDTLSVQVTDSNNCVGISSIFYSEKYPTPQASITYDSTLFCLGDSVRLAADSGFVNYSWSNGKYGEEIFQINSDSISLEVTDSNGCKLEIPGTFIKSLDTTITISALGSTQFCDGDSVVIIADSLMQNSLWSNLTTKDTLVAKTSDTITLSGYKSNGCFAHSNEVIAKVFPTPTPQLFSNGPFSICENDSIIFFTVNPHFSYLWMDSSTSSNIVVRSSDSVWVKVTNQIGCVGYSNGQKVKVNPNPKPILSFSNDTLLCAGDSTKISTFNPYSLYSWNDGDSVSQKKVHQAGSFFVTVTDSLGCVGVSNILNTYWLDTAISIFPNIDQIICEGQSIQFTSSPSYSNYLWTTGDTANSINISKSDTIQLEITNAFGCKGKSEKVIVNVKPNPNPTIMAKGDTTFCDGEYVILKLNEVFQTINWNFGGNSDSIIANQTGTYFVNVTDSNNCSGISNSIDIEVYPLPPIPIITYNGFSGFLTSSESGNLQWFRDSVLLAGETSTILFPDVNGNYYISLTNSDGCTVYSSSYLFNKTSVKPPNDSNQTIIFPNPNSGDFWVSSQDLIERVTIYAISGRIVKNYNKVNSNLIELNIRMYGFFFLEIQTNKEVLKKTIVISK